jgi:hypothetical protein
VENRDGEETRIGRDGEKEDQERGKREKERGKEGTYKQLCTY